MSYDPANSDTEKTLAQLNADFLDARGREDDVAWVRAAEGRLMFDEVGAAPAKLALSQLLPILRGTDESAEELFGDPKTWAREQEERWQQDGTPAHERHELLPAKEFLEASLIGATAITVILTLVTLFSDGWRTDLSWILFALPLLISLASLGLHQVWNLAVRKTTRTMTIAWSLAFLVLMGTLIGSAATLLKQSFGTGSTFWILAPLALFAVAYYAISSLMTAGSRTAKIIRSEDEWINQLKEQLRLRNDLSDRQLRTTIKETRDYAAAAGADLQDEFGSPQSYAASFETNFEFRARRDAWAWTAGSLLTAAVLALTIVVDGSLLTWQALSFAALLAGTVFYAAQSWRRSFKNSKARS